MKKVVLVSQIIMILLIAFGVVFIFDALHYGQHISEQALLIASDSDNGGYGLPETTLNTITIIGSTTFLLTGSIMTFLGGIGTIINYFFFVTKIMTRGSDDKGIQ